MSEIQTSPDFRRSLHTKCPKTRKDTPKTSGFQIGVWKPDFFVLFLDTYLSSNLYFVQFEFCLDFGQIRISDVQFLSIYCNGNSPHLDWDVFEEYCSQHDAPIRRFDVNLFEENQKSYNRILSTSSLIFPYSQSDSMIFNRVLLYWLLTTLSDHTSCFDVNTFYAIY